MAGKSEECGLLGASFPGVITSSVKLSEAVLVQEQVIFCPELPELSVSVMMTSCMGGTCIPPPVGHS